MFLFLASLSQPRLIFSHPPFIPLFSWVLGRFSHLVCGFFPDTLIWFLQTPGARMSLSLTLVVEPSFHVLWNMMPTALSFFFFRIGLPSPFDIPLGFFYPVRSKITNWSLGHVNHSWARLFSLSLHSSSSSMMLLFCLNACNGLVLPTLCNARVFSRHSFALPLFLLGTPPQGCVFFLSTISDVERHRRFAARFTLFQRRAPLIPLVYAFF